MSEEPSQARKESELVHLAQEWSCESICRASTSRGLPYRSSGDCDADSYYSYLSSDCSCASERKITSACCVRPLAIVDSTAKIHKSKWKTFKNYVKRNLKRKRIKENKTTPKNEEKENGNVEEDNAG